MNPVVHFELPAKDKKRMRDFYTSVFGWKAHELGPEMGGYITVTTTETDEKSGRPHNPGAINGGLYTPDPSKGAVAPSLVIAVEDVQEHIKKITAAGGKLIDGPMEIPGVGLYAGFEDTEGNKLSILKPSTDM